MHRFHPWSGVLAVPCLLASVHATAQASETERRSAVIEEIVVTAQRREESANDVGMGIQAFSQSQMDRVQVSSVEDLTALVPSFNVSQSYQGVPTYTLRGIGFNTINLSATSTVGIYEDEVSRPYPILNAGPTYDLERVEVLKGPQGTLFGRNTTAGLINLVTAKPTEDFEARFSGGVGNYETYNLEGMVSGPLGERVQGRLAFRSENSGKGWQKSVSRDERNGEVERLGVRGSISIEASDRFFIDASYSYWDNRSDPLAAQAIGFTPATTGSPFNTPGVEAFVAANPPSNAEDADWVPYPVRSADIGTGLGISSPLEEDATFHGAKLRLEYDFGDTVRLISLTGYNDFERKGISDWSGAPYEVLIQDFDGTIESISEELRLEGSTDRTNWMVGAYYADDELLDSNRTLLGQNANVALVRAATSGIVANPAYPGPYTLTEVSQAFRTFRDVGEFDTSTASVFANVDWMLADTFTLTTGLRYTEDEQDYVGCSRDVNGNMLPNVNTFNIFLYQPLYGTPIGATISPIGVGDCVTFDTATASFGPVTSKLDENNWSWRVAGNWTPADDVLLFASVSQGYKAGSTPVNAANIADQNAPASQEKLLAYEIGTKAALLDRRLQANVSLFYYDYTDKQLAAFFADPIYTALARLQNIPDSEAYGFDGELTMNFSPSLTAIASATWLDTKVIGYQGINAAGQPQSYDGAEFLYSPEFTGSLTLFYDRPLGNGWGVQAALNGRYQSDSSASLADDPLYKIDSYGLVNASIGVHALDGPWQVMLWARNLTDEYYWTAVSSNANTVVRFPGRSRTWGLTVNYEL